MTGMDNTWQLGDLDDALAAIRQHPDRDRDYVVQDGPIRILINPSTQIWANMPGDEPGQTVIGHQCTVQAWQGDVDPQLLAEGATPELGELRELTRTVRARAHARLSVTTPDTRRRIQHATTALRAVEEELRAAQERQREAIRAAVFSGISPEDAAEDARLSTAEVHEIVATGDQPGSTFVTGA